MNSELVNRPRPNLEEMKTNYPIRRCNSDENFLLRFFCLSDDVWGQDTHWLGKTHPCTEPKKPCRHCKDGVPIRWYGYVAATDHTRSKLFLAELTPGVMAEVDGFYRAFKTLRGGFITLNRPKKRSKSRIDITLAPATSAVKPADLPEAFDVEFTLMKIYGLVGKKVNNQKWEDGVEIVELTNEKRQVVQGYACNPRFGEGLFELDGQQHLPLANGRPKSA